VNPYVYSAEKDEEGMWLDAETTSNGDLLFSILMKNPGGGYDAGDAYIMNDTQVKEFMQFLQAWLDHASVHNAK